MCLYAVIDTSAAGRCIGLLDSYGKVHVARIVAGAWVAFGDELHGPHPTLGFHFLVDGRSGQRLGVHFVDVRVSRQAMLDHLHLRPAPPAPAPRPRANAAAEPAAAERDRSPVDVLPRLDDEVGRPRLRRHG